jgi:hypothetical protein
MNTGKWITRLERRELETFEALNDFVVTLFEDFPVRVLRAMKDKFRAYFPGLVSHTKWV